MSKVRVGLLGVGNCASSLVQGIHYYRDGQGAGRSGLMHENIGGYGAGDVEVVAAFDIDARKVGTDLSEAIFAPPLSMIAIMPLTHTLPLAHNMPLVLGRSPPSWRIACRSALANPLKQASTIWCAFSPSTSM